MERKQTLFLLSVLVGTAHLATLATGVGSFWFADELMQYIEQPFLALHGLPASAWEFQAGTRNWTFPGIILVVLWPLKVLGVAGPITALLVLRLLTKLLFVGAWIRFAQGLVPRSRQWVDWLPAAAVGLFPVMTLATNHTLSEVGSLIFLLWGTGEWLLALDGRTGRARFAGIAFGLAVLVRLQSAVLVPFWVLLAWWPRRQAVSAAPLGALALSLLVTLAAGGALDAVTYGSFGHSMVANLTAHLGDGGKLFQVMGTQPWSHYVAQLWQGAPLAFIVVCALGVVGVVSAPREPWAWSALLFVAVHTAIPHKELRFLLPALPFALVGAGQGLVVLVNLVQGRVGRWAGVLLVAAILLASSAPAYRLARSDGEEARITRLLSAVGREREPAMLITATPGRTVWPAFSRFVVGSATFSAQQVTQEQLARACATDASRGALYLFGPENELTSLLAAAQDSGCHPSLVDAALPWQLHRLR